MIGQLNQRAWNLVETLTEQAERLRIRQHTLPGGGTWWDFGIDTEGGLEAGLLLSRVCLSDLARVECVPEFIGLQSWPHIQVMLDHPVEGCLCSQYAGWKVAVGEFFGMGSGPMRAVAGREELFEKLDFQESSTVAVGILETDKAPTDEVFAELAAKTGLGQANICVLAAPTSSQAGSCQIVARSVETALHKLFELGFDVHRVRSAFGTAPLSPAGADFLTSLGRTNDAILYGGRVHLWVSGDPQDLAEIGPKVPSDSSSEHGRPFREIFKAADYDFYKIDGHLFSPAEIVFNSLETGEVFRFGQTAPEVLKKSFGL